MKNSAKFSVLLSCIIVTVSCSTDSPVQNQISDLSPINSGSDQPENIATGNEENSINYFFGFLDGDGSSNTYLDRPVDEFDNQLFIGRWKITKLGIDNNNDGTIMYYNYEDFDHKNCGESFLQFNIDGTVFENSYYSNAGECTLFSEIDTWELIETNRFKIYVYDNIYLLKATKTELVLKYDWIFENSLYAPMQVYYHYQRDKSLED
ncbi:hypothetical protein MKO06_02830 [Gramella sp. GC03-9]|uniref:Lipocalin-like domain-containing protein n=1 Tax=Christiangramia oceanisediminis TaxID=2920386 RepID=A0A9X2KW19_9FLAO|nr:hypothetical protein [Gramella oceanisediminis]MCP9198824.1 hypothetical protein [Gramella oceanisediminis]